MTDIITQFIRVSIHALTRSATMGGEKMGLSEDVSIHALTRSATVPSFCRRNNSPFQSTHSRGVRPCCSVTAFSRSCFNPRTHEECDTAMVMHAEHIPSFNPRTHQECDLRQDADIYVINRVSIHALTRSATENSLP